MGSRFKLFFWNNNSSKYQKSNPHLRGHSYDDAVALDPPLKGSYSVAGNGPDIVGEIQRAQAARAKRLSNSGHTPTRSLASQHVISRVDNVPLDRPRTAPENGNGAAFGGAGTSTLSASDVAAKRKKLRRYSMKSSRMSVDSSRQNSMKSFPTEPPPLPKPAKDLSTYQPTGATCANNRPSSQSSRKPHSNLPEAHSQAKPSREQSWYIDLLKAHSVNQEQSRGGIKPYVDLMEAHSSFSQPRDESRPQSKPSARREYGEDVADRNISKHGPRGTGTRESRRLDISVPELSYLKYVYRQKNLDIEGSPSRVASALGHVLGPDDDTTPTTTPATQTTPQSFKPTATAKTSSIRSTSFSLSRPGTVFPPPRLDSRAYTKNQNDAPGNNGTVTVAHDAQGRRQSPLPASPTSASDVPIRDPRRHSIGNSKRPTSSSGRGRSPHRLKEPPPVPPAYTVPRTYSLQSTHTSNPPTVPRASSVQTRHISNPSTARDTSTSRQEQQTTSAAHKSTAAVSNPKSTKSQRSSYSAFVQEQNPMSGNSESTTIEYVPNLKRTKSQRSSYSAFPTSSQTSQPKEPKSNRSSVAQRTSGAPSLDGIVDLTNTVDTDVTTKTLPAVTHEHVTPTQHNIRREAITREIHTHDVYHRVLPVIETEILPTKHYIKGPDGTLIPIPESEVPRHSISGNPNGNWEVAKSENAGSDLPSVLRRPHSRAGSASYPAPEEGAMPPVAGYRTAPRPRENRSRGNSLKSISSKALEPILSSKKENIAKEGYPRTEYVWRHPPVFETVDGKTQPIYIGAGLGDITRTASVSDDSDSTGEAISNDTRGTKGEEALLFRDSGYGSGGMLPGLKEASPMAELGRGRVVVNDCDSGLGTAVGKVKVDGNAEISAKQMTRKPVGETDKECRIRRSSVAGLENGINRLSMSHTQ